MKPISRIILLAFIAFSSSIYAESILIRNATVHTMTAEGTISTDIFVKDGVVQRIGQDLSEEDADTIIVAAGRPLTPGLFAGIAGIGIGEVSGADETMDGSLEFSDMRPEFDVSSAYNPHSSLVPVARIEGFSFTLLGAGTSTIIGGRGRMVSLDGGYDSFAGDQVLYISVGGRAAGRTGGSRAGIWMMLEQAMDEAGNPTASNEPGLLTRNGRRVLAGFAGGGTVIFSVDRASDILQTIRFASKFGFNAVIEGGAEAWMVAEQLASAKIPVMLSPLENLPSSFDALGSRLDNAALLHAAGVTVVISGAGSHNARKQRQFAGNAVSHGLPHDAGLAALSSNPAGIFGVDSQQGTIELGKTANLVLWSGDPLEVTTVAESVIINGALVPMESRQTKLRDRYLPENPEMPRAYIKP